MSMNFHLPRMSAIVDDLGTVRGALDDLDDLDVDDDGLGDPAVADAVREVRDGWRLQRRDLDDTLTRLTAFVDAVADAAAEADASLVTGSGR